MIISEGINIIVREIMIAKTETKLCPFCAEEIKKAAIVCKHCGRELPGFEKHSLLKTPLDLENTETVKNEGGSIKFGVVPGVVFTAIYILSRISILTEAAQVGGLAFRAVLFNLAMQSLFVFLIFYVIGSVGNWLWRKNPIYLWGIMLILVAGSMYSSNVNNNNDQVSINPTVVAKSPTVVALTTQKQFVFPTQDILVNCIRWDQVTRKHLGRVICTYGIIIKRHTDGCITYFRFSIQAGTLMMTAPICSVAPLTSQIVIEDGDCIAVTGEIREPYTRTRLEIMPYEIKKVSSITKMLKC